MNFIGAFIRLFRLPNLVIVFLTLYIPYWHVLRPALLKSGGIPVLTERLFYYLAVATVLTTLGGYVLNDYYDRHIDAINKPSRVFWGRYLPAPIALVFYGCIVAVVHYLALTIDAELPTANRWPLWVFPGVSFLLFIYAWQLKCTAILGNLLVSLLCAVVPILLIFPEERPLQIAGYERPLIIQQAVGLVWLYALFAFITNLLREQVKDLEDFSGDSECGCNTLAVTRGIRFARKPATATAATLVILTLFLLIFWYETGAPSWQFLAGAIFLLAPGLITAISLNRAQTTRDFTKLSLWIKLIMVAGLFLLIRDWPTAFTDMMHL